MATLRGYLGRCPRHGPVTRVTDLDFYRWCNGDIHCTTCHRRLDFDLIEGRTGPGRCDARCWDAIRSSCKCSCGGHEHARTFGVFERAD